MKKLVFLTLMAFLFSVTFSVTAYGQTTKAKVQSHPTVKTVKKPVSKAPVKTGVKKDYYGYASLEEADKAYNKYRFICDVHRSDYYMKSDSPIYIDGSDPEFEKAADEVMRMNRIGYIDKDTRINTAIKNRVKNNPTKNDIERQAIYRNIERNMKIGLIYRNGQ